MRFLMRCKKKIRIKFLLLSSGYNINKSKNMYNIYQLSFCDV
ncbi:hypothetical protein [Clostridium bornimense]